MNILDLRTVLFSYVVSNAICSLVMASLWTQNRKRSPGLGYWLAGFITQFFGILLIALRNVIPDFFSIIIGNGLLAAQALLIFIGLEKYCPQTRLSNSQLCSHCFVSTRLYLLYIHSTQSISPHAQYFLRHVNYYCTKCMASAPSSKNRLSPCHKNGRVDFCCLCTCKRWKVCD